MLSFDVVIKDVHYINFAIIELIYG